MIRPPKFRSNLYENAQRYTLTAALAKRTILDAGPEHERKRLDQFVAANLATEYSRSQVTRMIKAGLVTLNGGVARASAALHRGDRVEIKPPSAPVAVSAPPSAPGIEGLFADSGLMVVNNPPGMTLRPPPRH